MKRPDEAILAFDRAAGIDPGDPRIYLLRGDSRYQLGDVEGAIAADFQASVTLDPYDYVHHRALAVAYLATGRHVEARKAVDDGIDRVKTPRRSRLILLQARVADRQARLAPRARRQPILREVLARLQQHEEATGHQMSSAERADVHARRAYLHVGLREKGAAERLVSSALDLDPGHEEALNIRESFESDRGPVWTLPPWSTRGAVWCLGVGWFAALLVIRSLGMSPQELLVVVLSLVLAPLLLPSLPSLTARIGGINIAGLAVELKPNDPVDEQVHVDLDLSASELLRVSGFSSHGTAGYVDVLAPESNKKGAEAADRAVKGAEEKLKKQAEMVVLNLHRSHLSGDEMGTSLIREILVARMQEPGEVDFGKVIVMNGNEIWFPDRGL